MLEFRLLFYPVSRASVAVTVIVISLLVKPAITKRLVFSKPLLSTRLGWRPNFKKRRKKDKVLPGFEPGTFCVLGRCDNHYTTAPTWSSPPFLLHVVVGNVKYWDLGKLAISLR